MLKDSRFIQSHFAYCSSDVKHVFEEDGKVLSVLFNNFQEILKLVLFGCKLAVVVLDQSNPWLCMVIDSRKFLNSFLCDTECLIDLSNCIETA